MQAPDSAQSCANKLKVLADPTRLAVVEALMKGPRHVGELNEALNMDQSLLSHHLKVMRDAGVVTSTRDGKAVLYQLDPSVVTNKKRKSIDLGCCRLDFESPDVE